MMLWYRCNGGHLLVYRESGMLLAGMDRVSEGAPVVFVVDDDASVRESLELLIRTAGWVPRTFASARDFLSCAEIAAPGCLVLDVHLPDLDGLDLRSASRSIGTTFPSSSSPATATCRWRCGR
jgi:DNA-binding NtrC family response regulator